MNTRLFSLQSYLACLLLAPFFISSKCNKDDALPEYYFRCKINGQDYRPNSCANCMRAQILGDTTFLLNGNAGFESVGLGVIKLDKIPISTEKYILNMNPQINGYYDNSPQVDDIFKTDALRIGQLIITNIDKSNKLISGTFHFQAYNPVQDKTVNITDGKFRLVYTDY